MPLKLIMFDLDGTLADTLADITDSLNYTLGAFGFKPLSKAHVRKIVGEGVSILVEKALRSEQGGEALLYRDQVIKKFLERYSAHPVDNTYLYPGVKETLELLKEYKMAIISNKTLFLTEKILKELGIDKYFEAVVGPEAGRKPSPGPINHLLRKIGIAPNEAVIVGDSIYDIEAGKNAGLMAAIGVTYGYGDRETLGGADYVIDNIGELVHILYGKKEMAERRKEERYPLPAQSREYLALSVRSDGAFETLPARILDFSLHGLSFETMKPFERGEHLTCRLSAPKSLSQVVEFKFKVIHSRQKDAVFLVGGTVSEISSELWLRVLKKVYDFIEERKGEVF